MTTASASPQATSVMAAANELWQAVRRRHEQIPDATVVVVPGRQPGCPSTPWEARGALFISLGTASAAAGPEQVLRVLLHQGAHLLAPRPGTNEGRYHGEAFRQEAEELGLDAGVPRPSLGWMNTVLAAGTAQDYADELAALVPVAGIPSQRAAARPGGSRNGISAHCQCDPPRAIRIRGASAANELAADPIFCTRCRHDFAAAVNS